MAFLAGLVVFGSALGLSWWTHGSGVVHDDAARHISIPQALTVPLTVQVAHDGTDVWFRYRWLAPNAGIFHDMLRFDGSAWQVRGGAVPGFNTDGLHEDRVSMMLDDGSVPEFGRYGGYVAIGDGHAGFTVEQDGLAAAEVDIGWCEIAQALVAGAGTEDFWLIFTLLAVTMSQKSSVPQLRSSVPGVLTPDSRRSSRRTRSCPVRQRRWPSWSCESSCSPEV
ncbi:ethylbenzene dehydrogenase-related protein [Falsiroseomonas sp. E2-1-a20]|uniref:ethylbenzene dehydrogenase-related protein n=1 Tax=Falsiroseomonas sp. E2-1-a20 TaxID=3239300 RepID=UPI003F3D88FE